MTFRYYKVGKLIVVILALSTLLDYIFKLIAPYFNMLSPDHIIRAPSNVAIILGVLALYNKTLWKYPFFRKLVTVPDLNGRYEGKLISDYTDGKGNKIEKFCVIEITQTASSIKVYSYFKYDNDVLKNTSSISNLEDIYCGNDNFYHVRFIYQNQGSNTKDGFKKHDGFNDLKYFPDTNTLMGPYFTDPDRKNKGIIEAKFISKQLKGRL